jgi:cation diffusion facilitator CzcD-associated flavoprotein CzcO
MVVDDKPMQMESAVKPVLIVGAGVSGLVLAQHLRQQGVPFQVFERDSNWTYRGIGWGLTIHWALPALKSALPQDIFDRLPETYVDRPSAERGELTYFPFYDLSTGERKFSQPKASKTERIRVTRDRLRRLLATDIEIQVLPVPNLTNILLTP